MKCLNASLFAVAALVAAFTLAPGCAPEDGSAELEQGRRAFEVGDCAKARKAFVSCLEYDAGNVDALVYLARIALSLGELDEASARITAAAEIAGGDIDVKLLAAQIAWHRSDYKWARKLFSEIAGDGSLDAKIRARGWSGLGIVEATEENPDLARVAYLMAIRTDPRCAPAWYQLGLLYRDGFGYYEAALSQFDCYVRLDEMASPRVQKVQSTIIPAIKEMIARTLHDRPGATQRDSGACAKLVQSAEAAFRKGAYKDARRQFEAAVAKDRLSHAAAAGLARTILRCDGTNAGQQKAFEYLRQACILKPFSTALFLEAGQLAVKLGNHAQAVELYSRAVAANPVSLDAIDGLIRSLRRVANQEAANAYQKYRDSIKPVRR